MSEDLSREVAKRILSLREESETWKAFAERHGLTSSGVGNWRNQGDGASLEAVAKVLEHHRPRLSAAWLLAGRPPRYLPEGERVDDSVRRELEGYAHRLDAIRRIAGGEISPETLRRLESGEAVAEEVSGSLAETQRGSESTEAAQS